MKQPQKRNQLVRSAEVKIGLTKQKLQLTLRPNLLGKKKGMYNNNLINQRLEGQLLILRARNIKLLSIDLRGNNNQDERRKTYSSLPRREQ
ncbi:MAG TPA: hypothetical protein ENF17_02570 [Candidatus Aminicenantes bacterium]|nr:hypothetical protein [Candidatus Aminicenantes bacterium]